MFFGCRRRDHDFIYEEELREFERQGVMQLEVAFSREGKAKRYVQHALEERGVEVQLVAQLGDLGLQLRDGAEAEEEAAAVKMQCLYRAKKAKKEMERRTKVEIKSRE